MRATIYVVSCCYHFSHNKRLLLFPTQTNDFFVSTWGASTDGILQFLGFPPGLDINVVIANIQNEMQVALSILISGRRKLKLEDEQSKSLRSSHRDLEEKVSENAKPANPCDKANPNAAGGLETAGKNCDGAKEVEIPNPDASESFSRTISFINSLLLISYEQC